MLAGSVLASGQGPMAQQRADKTLKMITSEAPSPLFSHSSLKGTRPTELLENENITRAPRKKMNNWLEL